jgi:hypothetical protein
MPLIDEGEVESNDTYVSHILGSAGAAVKFFVARGLAERDRIAVEGIPMSIRCFKPPSPCTVLSWNCAVRRIQSNADTFWVPKNPGCV